MDNLLRELISNYYFKHIFDQLDIEVAIFDNKGRYQYVSASAINDDEIREWVIGKDNFEYVEYRNKPLEIASKRHDAIMKAIKEKKAVDINEKLITDSGKELYYVRKVFPIINSDDEVKGVVGYGINLTDSIISQRAVEESEAKYRTIFENSPDAILVFDFDQRKYIDCNQNAIELFQMPKETLLEMDPHKLSPEFQSNGQKSKTIIEKNINAVLEGEDVRLEWDVKRVDGTIIPCEINLVKLPSENRRLIRTSLLDIRDRLKMEKEKNKLQRKILHTQKLESLGILAGGIAHDFNNLLAGIMGYTSIALNEINENSPITPYLNEIKKITNNAAEVTNQMLAYSGKGNFETETTKLSNLVKDMENLVRISVTKKINLIYHINNNKFWVNIDTTQIKQIIINLVTNSAESYETNSNGQIVVSVGDIVDPKKNPELFYFGNFIKSKYSYLQVEDFGSGIKSETLKKIFDPFYSTKFTGRGLGLSVVQGIVRAHDGIIEIETEENRGTRFRIYFPSVEKQFTFDEKEEQTVNLETNKSSTVLICDDEKYIRDILKNMLCEMGYKVIVAEHGKNALKQYEKHKDEVKIVIVDLTMPELDGEQTYNRLKEINPKINIIMTSGYSMNELKDGLDILENYHFLQKPFDFEILKNLIVNIETLD